MYREIELSWSETAQLGILVNLGEREFGRLRGKITKQTLGSIKWNSKNDYGTRKISNISGNFQVP